MTFNDAALNVGANAMAGVALYGALHSADPGASGTNETSAGRVLLNWAAAANGDISISAPLAFTGGAASGAVQYVGYWSSSSGGTYYGKQLLTGDTSFNAAGEYTLNSLTENGSAA